MSDKGSVFQKGAGGSNFEQHVQAAFIVTLITKGNAPCIPTNEVVEVTLQATNRGWDTDDLLVIANSALGVHQLLMQSKHNITFSDNKLFNEVIASFWKDFKNSKFDKNKDRLIIVKNRLNNIEKNHIKGVLNFAKTHASEVDFLSEVIRVQEKKERLDIFKAALKLANNNTDVSDKETWEFLRCVDVLGYDFLNQGSVDETSILNLIKLSKGNDVTVSETEIWNMILALVTKFNPNGGSLTTDSVKTEEVYALFNAQKLSSVYNSVEKLRKDSEAILNPLKSKIGTLGNEFHIERPEINARIKTAFSSENFTIITGKPGVGKSAVTKDVLSTEFKSASIFVFRADQFNVPHLANVLTGLGISDPLQDLLSCISAIPDKVIFIDSLEKLLEGDPENAFKQLLAFLKQYPHIKIIGTSRKYAVDLIIQKFGLEPKEVDSVEVLPLTDEELNIVAAKFPVLQGVLQNPKINELLQSPKYIDFALRSLGKSAEDYSTMSVTEFKDKLWNNLVEDVTMRKAGLAGKRRKAFASITLKRAKRMILFVEPDDGIDDEAVEMLEKDEIIFKDGDNARFAPAHDILEDWALVKYISSKYEEFPKAKDLFLNIGNEPAIRRAFRLWVEDFLIDNNAKISSLIKETVADDTIERYWSDELLIAVFKSNNSSSFFETFENELLDNNCSLLGRCLHIIRTACKENRGIVKGVSFLFPMGSGWIETLLFLKKHITKADSLRLLIMNFLYDWEYRQLYDPDISEQELFAVKDIILHYLNQLESEDEFWLGSDMENKRHNLISLLFNLSDILKTEITDLVRRALAEKEYSNWRTGDFYDTLIKSLLTGVGTINLCANLPELVLEVASKSWKLKLPDPDSEEYREHSIYRSNRLDREECWGINSYPSNFPSSIYKTPLYNILNSHPFLGLKFITDFLNYSVDFYVKADCGYKHEIIQVEIELNDGTKKQLWGAFELWAAHRGLSVTDYLLESLLMSLEKFILNLASKKTDLSRKNLAFVIDYILKNSNNVATLGVLSSVFIAYPNEVGEEILPLLSIGECYRWDIQRRLQESRSLSPYDNTIPFAQKERHEFNQLPHRTKHRRGLVDFIFDYQLDIRTLNQGIQAVFDKLKIASENQDIVWKKILTEIDVRNLEVGEYDEKIGGFPIQPKYNEEISKFIESGQDDFKEQTTTLNYGGLIMNAYDEKESITFEQWSECYNHYSDKNNINNLYARPVSLAAIGLRQFSEQLNEDQKGWCIVTILDTASLIIGRTFRQDFDLSPDYNLLEKDVALNSFHLVMANLDLKEDQDQVIYLIIYMLTAPFSEHEVRELTNYIRRVFFRKFPDFAKRIWTGLIKYSAFKKENNKPRHLVSEEERQEALKKEEELVRELSSETDGTIDIQSIDFKKYNTFILAKALVVTPYYTNEVIYTEFIKTLIPLIVDDFKLEPSYSYNRSSDARMLHHSESYDIQWFFVELLLNGDFTFCCNVVDLLLDPIYLEERKPSRSSRDFFEFISKIIEYVICALDDEISKSKDEVSNKAKIEAFWNVWGYLQTKIKNSGKAYFTSTLLLGISWNDESTHWRPLENKSDFYYKLIQDFGPGNSKTIINVFSTIGEKTFLPEGITRLVQLLQNADEQSSLMSSSAERLIKRLFYNHITKIKKDRQLINDFVWILDKMVELGSSSAYLFRENVITYKSSN